MVTGFGLVAATRRRGLAWPDYLARSQCRLGRVRQRQLSGKIRSGAQRAVVGHNRTVVSPNLSCGSVRWSGAGKGLRSWICLSGGARQNGFRRVSVG